MSVVLQQVGAFLTELGSLAVMTSFVGLIEFALTFFFLFFFLRDRDAVLVGVRDILPLSASETDGILHAAGDTIFATVTGRSWWVSSRAFSAASCSGGSICPQRGSGGS
jgi:predicted PurR-regulated permease PerM